MNQSYFCEMVAFMLSCLAITVFAEDTSVTAITDTASLQTAVAEWCNDPVVAESTYGHISGWNTGGATDMSRLFIDYCSTKSTFNEDISAWNVGSVTTMRTMFGQANSFNQDISAWNVGSVTDMGVMFYQASSFNQDISAWNVGSVTYMGYMFYGATSFNQVLCWDTSLSDSTWTGSSGSITTDYATCSAPSPTSSPTANPTSSPTSTPSANPTSSPTAGPTSSPTFSPTANPTASPTPDCHDTTWTDGQNGKGCDWVAYNPERRCNKRFSSTNMCAHEGCPLTCDNCDGCFDDKTWADAKNGKGCWWIARDPDKRCTKRSSSVADGEVQATDACLFSCENCGA